MRRRRFLGTVATGVVAGAAGCAGGESQNSSGDGDNETRSDSDGGAAPFEHPGTLGSSFAANGNYPADGDPSDGYGPSFSDAPAAPKADPASFETLAVNSETIRLAPIDVVEKWYRRGEARFVDARGLTQYERSHVYGAVLSTAQRDSTGGGIEGWSTDGRIITYCGCPHHLSSIRAAGLQKAGYSNVFALDEGFTAWSDAGYPMGGTSFREGDQGTVSEWTLDGTVAAVDRGSYAWASEGRQYEAAPIRADGTFSLHLKFVDVDGTTPVEVSTPEYTLTQPLETLANGVIRG